MRSGQEVSRDREQTPHSSWSDGVRKNRNESRKGRLGRVAGRQRNRGRSSIKEREREGGKRGEEEEQGKLKKGRSVFNWRWMLAARASQVHTNTASVCLTPTL